MKWFIGRWHSHVKWRVDLWRASCFTYGCRWIRHSICEWGMSQINEMAYWSVALICKMACWYRNTLQHAATRCNTLQHAATRCNTLHALIGQWHSHVKRRIHLWRVSRTYGWGMSQIKTPFHMWMRHVTDQQVLAHTNEPYIYRLHDSCGPFGATTHCNMRQHAATRCNTLQHVATRCNTLQHAAPCCNTLQHTATCCNTWLVWAPWCH